MAATFQFCEDNGTAVGTPARGTTRTTGVTNVNWKTADDTTTAYTAAPVTAAQNSYTKYQFGVFTGSYNEVKSGIWQHTYNTNGALMGAGLTIKGYVSGSGLYATPALTTNSALIFDMTSTGALSTGYTVRLGINGPEHTGKGVSSTGATVNPWGATTYTEYIATQLQTTSSAAAGDTAQSVWTFQWTEN